MKRRTALSVWGAALVAGSPVLAQIGPRGPAPILGRIEVGAGVSVVVHNLGMPVEVASLDTGHLWTWRTPHAHLRVTTDDDANVRVVDEKPLDDSDTLSLSVEGKPVRIKLFGYTTAQADADLNALAAFSSQTTRVYTLSPTRQLVLVFGSDGTLSRAIYGESGVIARMGLVATSVDLLKNQRYYAPRLRTAPSPVPGAAHETIVRSAIGRDGQIVSVDVAVSSNDKAADDRALQIARTAKWMPAKYDAVNIPSVVFRMIGT